MNPTTLLNCCRMCGATSYRPVIARDDSGAMRPSGLYQCSGCSVVFTDPKAWRESGPEEPAPDAAPIKPLTPVTITVADALAAVPFGAGFRPAGPPGLSASHGPGAD